MSYKTVQRLHPAMRDDIGDLITQRPLPGPRIEQVDPFLFLNHHGPQVYPPHNRGLPFGPHPHRGFETVTFILDGLLAHRDSAGHESVIGPGGVQWMTAGRGLVHAEVSPREFMQAGGPLEILQLWVNLPPALKMTAPRYTGLQRDQIPVIESEDGKVRMQLVAGEYGGVTGPFESLTGVFMSTVEMKAGGLLYLDKLLERNVFLYVVRGVINIAPDTITAFHLAELDTVADELEIRAEQDCLLLLGHAEPIREPVVSHGPFVMNTREEINQAILDYQAGRFGAPI
ncbi:Putative quercetin 2,3-dioxygenase Rv0181c [Massilia sp. Bi118]|uniref:pirin family protein n=1 Tax=Massilia sp. Bi118 TaxID=2822346 RepID=UPI001D9A237F|nr:pirin family protein [Massilia sp. Bi118]CAH0267364.1 Putative quercetin 2,3-dioxygenase Rv0181c [Massilia sp. Bi118]